MIRGVGVGEGSGEGEGLGEGVCAKELIGTREATKPAAPNAGSSLTNERRLFEVFARC